MIHSLEPTHRLLATGLHKHLRRSLKKSWGSYRTRFRCCRQEFSEASVHRLRVEARRLLALLNLLQPFVGDACIEKPRRLIKEWLGRFGRLRDTHVELIYLESKLREFPGARAFRNALRRRERRLARKLGICVHRARLGRIKRAMAPLRQKVRRKLRPARAEGRHSKRLLQAVDDAFAAVIDLQPRNRAGEGRDSDDSAAGVDLGSIHQMRVAFKRFRYMVELLQPMLPGTLQRHLRAMRGFQRRMGDIQDTAVLLERLAKFRRKKPQAASATRAFHRDVQQRQHALVREFLDSLDLLNSFCPSPRPRADGHQAAGRGRMKRT